ncbi:MAG: transglutaminase family protein [Verrucomicrobiales bacterium]|nr:transglutaminase family protein [Verrucomicrobiales bacterium]
MRLNIVHRTRYRYSSPVSENFNEVRLQPVSDDGQECHHYELKTSPVASLRRYHDFHLNLVDHFYIGEPHESLEIEARSVVTTLRDPRRLEGVSFPRSRLGECLRLERCYDFLQRSEYVAQDVEVWRMAQDVGMGHDDAWGLALAMLHHVYREFTYDPAATTVHTRLLEVLALKRGVCQDFAHIMIGLCRISGIPARYVSGYLYVKPGENLRGELASHAWVEVYLPGHGWLGLDPTNNCPVDQHHVKMAVGRDYADAAPIRGNFKGRASQQMTVDLKIVREDLDA